MNCDCTIFSAGCAVCNAPPTDPIGTEPRTFADYGRTFRVGMEAIVSDGVSWYAYLHVNGSIHSKRYNDDPGDLEECSNSTFVRFVSDVYNAGNKADADAMAVRLCEAYLSSRR